MLLTESIYLGPVGSRETIRGPGWRLDGQGEQVSALSGHGLREAGGTPRVLDRAVLYLTPDKMPRKPRLVEISQALSTLTGLESVPTMEFRLCSDNIPSTT